MSKPFITYTTQIEKLKSEKNLIIVDSDFAVEALQNISYYALIGGYKRPFIDIHTRKYINEARLKISYLFMNLMKNCVDSFLNIYAV